MKFSHPLMHNNFTASDLRVAINLLKKKNIILKDENISISDFSISKEDLATLIQLKISGKLSTPNYKKSITLMFKNSKSVEEVLQKNNLLNENNVSDFHEILIEIINKYEKYSESSEFLDFHEISLKTEQNACILSLMVVLFCR